MSRPLSRRHLLALGGAGLSAAAVGWSSCSGGTPVAAEGGATRGARDPALRDVRRVVPGTLTRDGAGVRLRRALGGAALSVLDPFLLLDEIKSERPEDYVRGFPEHPHRGFETVTYMIQGAMEHRDSVGNRGRLGPGSAQWMTAGHGIVHSEMPQQTTGLLWGFQLWVNLPATKKMTRPRYQDIDPTRIPEVDLTGARVRVVAGEVAGKAGPVDGVVVAPTFLDVAVPAGASFEHGIAAGHAAFAYVLEGRVVLGRDQAAVSAGEIAVFGEGSRVVAASAAGGRFLLLAGQPIGEPVARRGPFVMNTQAELDRAFDDFRSGRLTDEG